MSAEMFIAKTVAKVCVALHPTLCVDLHPLSKPLPFGVSLQQTNGDFGVALNEGHLTQLVLSQCKPPPKVLLPEEDESVLRTRLVKMGFPKRETSAGWCACHNLWQPTG